MKFSSYSLTVVIKDVDGRKGLMIDEDLIHFGTFYLIQQLCCSHVRSMVLQMDEVIFKDMWRYFTMECGVPYVTMGLQIKKQR